MRQLLRHQTSVTRIMILLLMLTVFSRQAFATHAAGSDIKYRCLGGLQYEVTVTFYRDCGGVAEPGNIPLNVKSTNGASNFNITANKIAVTGGEITVPCATSASNCNGGLGTGIRQFVYSAIVTLPSEQTDWVFSYSVCCRNCAITTIYNPCASNSTLYVEAKLNNLDAPCNSSPTFSNIPIAFVCLGQTFNYNHGVLDPDGDSLNYTLIAPKLTSTTSVTFIPPASVTTPIASSTPFTLNAVTGDLNFTPSSVQIGILAILVKEYRNGVLIGSVIRDMQVYTTACSNNLPTASGINGTNNYNMTVCPNQQVCFTINTDDLDASQNVTLTTNSGISAASYTISSGARPTLTFCWTPTVADIDLNPKSFTVTVRDNACPNNGIQTYSYNLYVPSPNFTTSGTNVKCYGGNSGTATATPVYAGTFNYNWNTTPVQTTATAVNLPVGAYTVTVTDPNGCSLQQTVNVTQPGALNVSNVPVNPSCSMVCNGSVDVTVSGGTAPYSYNWSNGQTSQDLNALCAGTYTVTVTDANNCSVTQTVTLSNSYAITASATPVAVKCFGNATGTITLAVTNGTAPLSYSWSNGSGTQNLSAVNAGSYTVTITDAKGCTATASATISQPAAALNLSTSKTNILCFGNSTGSINTTVTGGTSPYSYAWNTGASSTSLSSVAAGTYTVTVTDANNCTSQSSVTLTQPAAALNVTLNKTDVKCFGNSTGAITSTVTGGTAGYTYLWNNGSTANSLSNISAGTYTVTVTDANGCTNQKSVTVTQPAAALSASGSVTNINCFGGTGSIALSVSGGTTAYSYNWSNGSSSASLTNAVAGTYTVTVTDANNCTVTSTSVITQPAAVLAATATGTNIKCNGNSTGAVTLAVSGGTTPYTYVWSTGATSQNISSQTAGSYQATVTDSKGCITNANATLTQPAAPLTATTTKTDISCFGNSTGQINAVAAGGTSPYSYSWNIGSTATSLSNVAAGNYTLTVTDANNCSTTANVTLTQPAAALSATITPVNVNCYGNSTGSVSVSASGGSTPYSYSWSNGGATSSNINLSAGTYSVTVTDSKGCSTTKSATVTQPAAALTLSSTVINVGCRNANTGSINVNPAGGTSPYSYAWSNGSSVKNPSSLAAGTYTVTVTDSKGCTASASYAVSQPAAVLSGNLSYTNVNCFGGHDGSALITVTGGTTAYSYLWNNGATTPAVSSLSAGTYTVTVTDANGCTVKSTQTITQPASSLSLSETHVDVTCYSLPMGSINLSVAGGTPAYSYLWSNGSTQEDVINIASGPYTVTVTDNQGCTAQKSVFISQPAGELNVSSSVTAVNCFGNSNGAINLTASSGTPPYHYIWSNGSTAEDLTGLVTGAYTATVEDANGCQLIITNFIAEPKMALAADITPTHILCFGLSTGAADLNVKGGTPPYNYSWNNSAVTQDLVSVPSGSYAVTVTDANGCTVNASTSLTQPAAALAIGSSVSQPNCTGINDGGIDLTITGGTGDYDIAWSNGETTEDLSQLSPGNYTVVITDANSCTVSQSFPVAFTASSMAVNTTIEPVKCKGDLTGSISLEVSGGTAPYTYALNQNAAAAINTNLAAGDYNIVITDVNGCNLNYNATVNEPIESLTASAVTNAILCYGNTTGAIDVTAYGGTAPYTYSWSDGSTAEDQNGIGSGDYTIVVTDLNQCTYSASWSMVQPAAPLAITFEVIDVACFGDSTGNIKADVTGGTPVYQLNWNTGNNLVALTGLPAGTYILTALDANGCSVSNQAEIIQPAEPLAVATVSQNINCFGDATGSATVTTTGGTTPYQYSWSTGDTVSTLVNINAGTYQYTITDSHQCISQGNISLSQPALPLSTTASTTAVSCNADASGGISINPSGGTAPYSYSWSNGATTRDLTGITAGDYTVTITDANGCVLTQTYNVAEPSAALTAQASITDVPCQSELTGVIQLTVSGGTQPYAYQWSNGDNQDHISQVATGTYTVTVTDQNGCTSVNSYTVNEPAAVVSVGTSVTNAKCYNSTDGGIDLTVAGGVAPYTFIWSSGATTEDLTNISAGTYNVTVTDSHMCPVILSLTVQQPSAPVSGSISGQAIACNGDSTGNITSIITGGTSPYTYSWNTGATTSSLTQVTAGTYTLTVTDANNCPFNTTLTVVQPSAAVSAVTVPHDITCHGNPTGWIDLTVNGGTAPYTYSWNNGGTVEDPQNMMAGNYTVTVTDQNGCTQIATARISEPTAGLTVSASVQQVSCSGNATGSVNLNVSGGTSPYQFNWNTGATIEDLINLQAGTYNVTVTDANGCTSVVNSVIQQPSATVSAAANITPAQCFSGQAGTISITAAGGTSPYNYVWSNGASTPNISGLAAGTYTLTLTDVNGCAFTNEYNVDDSTNLRLTTTGDATVCMGTLVTLESNITPQNNITLQWLYNGTPLNGAVSPTFTTPAAGTYMLVATSACGQDTSNAIDVIVRSLNNVSVSNNVIVCPGERVQLTAGGGVSYKWTPSAGLSDSDIPNPVAFPSASTEYTVLVKDDFGCTATATVIVSVMCDTLDIPNGFSPNDDGTNDTFVIDGIDKYPGNVLFIYNRWGNLIYKKRDYDNSWNGTSNVTGVMFGEQLPNGTYYYILDLNLNQKPYNGFVVLRR